MFDYEILESKPVPMAVVKELLKKKKGEEMSFEEKQAIEHLKALTKLSAKEAEKLEEELRKLEMRKLKDENIVKIVDILPTTMEELKLVLSDAKVPFNKEELEKIFEVVKRFVKG